MMKVIHVVYSMTFGGIETMLVNIANVQAGDNEVYLLMINNHYDEALIRGLNKKVKFINVGRPVSSKNPYYILKLNYLLWALHADVIHIHLSPILKVVFYPFFKKKMVFTMHHMPLKEEQKILRYVQRKYAISAAVKEGMKQLGYDSEVVPNGIIVSLIKQKNYTYTKKDIFRIIQVGRLSHKIKGQHVLIKAINKLKEKGIRNIELTFIGEGESEDYLKILVNKYGLENSIQFLGAKEPEYIFEHLCEYNLLVQPSIFEGFGLTVAEGMAAKVPVLVSNQEGPLEIIGNGKYGYYFENENAEDCANMIYKIMNQIDAIPGLVNKAYDRVCQLYNVKNTARIYLQKYKEIINAEK